MTRTQSVLLWLTLPATAPTDAQSMGSMNTKANPASYAPPADIVATKVMMEANLDRLQDFLLSISTPHSTIPAPDNPPSSSFPNNSTETHNNMKTESPTSFKEEVPQLVPYLPTYLPNTPGRSASPLDAPFLDTITADLAVVNYVFGTLFLCEPTTINTLKASKIMDLPSIVDADPSYFLDSNTINDAKESPWQLFIKLATVRQWTDASFVFSFSEDDWDALNVTHLEK